MNKQQQIKEIKRLLNKGNRIQVNCYNDSIKLWINDNKYINYIHYGQSAIKNNLKDLNWLINTILDAKNKPITYKTVDFVGWYS